MAFLTKEQILSAQGRPIVAVEVPELGGSVRARKPSAAASVRLQRLRKQVLEGTAQEEDFIAEVLHVVLVDEHGKPLWATRAEVEAGLEDLSPAQALALVNACQGVHKDEEPDAGNSKASPSSDSSTDSPSL